MVELRRLIVKHFNRDELRDLYFDLGLDDEEVPTDSKSALVRQLLTTSTQRGRLPDLITLCRQLRPGIAWPDPSLPLDIQDKENAALEHYLEWVQRQYNTIRLLSMSGPVPLDEIYTDVYVLDKPAYWQRGEAETLQAQFLSRHQSDSTKKRQSGVSVLTKTNRLFIVGKPGAGKTTFLRYLALQAAQKVLPLTKIPIYVELRRLASPDDDVFDLLVRQFTLSGFPGARRYVEQLLREGKGLVLLDGLDEVPAGNREVIHNQIDDLVKWCDNSHVVITCRSHAEKRLFAPFIYVEVADFTPEQVERFVGNWFGGKGTMVRGLLADLAKPEHQGIQELTAVPLLLAFLMYCL
jgi:hypothetical protein